MTEQHRQTVGANGSEDQDGPSAPRKPYEAPRLVKYGDIATLTQTGGLTKKDTGAKKQRIG